MKRLLFETHRWLGVVLALFMLSWFVSGLVIIYGGNATLSRGQQLARAELLQIQAGWLSVGEAWSRSAQARSVAARAEPTKKSGPAMGRRAGSAGEASQTPGPAQITEARLVRRADQPFWLVEDSKGARHTISALDGSLHRFSGNELQRIAQAWLGKQSAKLVDLGVAAPDTALRHLDGLKPLERIAVDDGWGRELVISARTGEVVRDANMLERSLFYLGSYLHFFRYLEDWGWGEYRRDALLWLVGFSLVACLTGLWIGWLRWRPGLLGKRTYSEGRVQPYRTFWLKWHFWGGLIGGTFASLWAFSGWLNGNPGQWFGPGAPSKAELAAYQGKTLPPALSVWQPADAADSKAVEISLHRLGEAGSILAIQADGQRQALAGSQIGFDQAAILAATQRLNPQASPAQAVLQLDYDAYYYPSKRRSNFDRPMPVWRVDLTDQGHTRLYADPMDGRLILRQDDNRRAYRWLFNALHFWDFGVLAWRPLWDVWSLTWISLGLLLSLSGVIIGCKRLKQTFRRKPAKARLATPEALATEQG